MSRPFTTRQAMTWSCVLSLGALAVIHALTYAAEPGPIDKKFYAVAERYLDETQKLLPTLASINGYHKYDSLLEDFSPQGVSKMTATFKGF